MRGMRDVLTVEVPGQIKSQANLRTSWHRKAEYARAWRHATTLLVGEALRRQGWDGLDPALPKNIVFTAFTRNVLDDDNLRSALKPVRDGLQDCGVIQDDRPSAGHLFVYQQRVDRKHPLRVVVAVQLRRRPVPIVEAK